MIVVSLAGSAAATPVAPLSVDANLPLSNQEILAALGRARTANNQLAKQFDAFRLEQDQRAADQQAKLVELATAIDRVAQELRNLDARVGDTSGELDRRRASTARANQWLAVAVALAIVAVLAGLATVARRINELEARLRGVEAGAPEPVKEDVEPPIAAA